MNAVKNAGEAMIVVWHWRDLRLEDNPALMAAVASGLPVLPLYVHHPEEQGEWPTGGASSWWLGHSLTALTRAYEQCGAALHVRTGPSLKILTEIIDRQKATKVVWNRRYEPALRQRDEEIMAYLTQRGIEVQVFEGCTLGAPTDLKPYKVFTPFYKAFKTSTTLTAPLKAPTRIRGPQAKSPTPFNLDLPTNASWTTKWSAIWQPGSLGAAARLRSFLDSVATYDKTRDLPAEEGVSRLSPHLHFGEISPRQIAWEVRNQPAAEPFVRQLIWREFAYRFLHEFPDTPLQPWRKEFASFPWRMDTRLLRAWQQGRTGYPIVDAGMRQLWQTGWMHNRVRMIVASFLVKDLLIPWQEGARWFWDTLVDADLANNTFGWQWAAGSGADAAPYFRIFNPTLQGQRFDPDGRYVLRYCPELARVPTKWIHEPWNAPGTVNYPSPIVDHNNARQAALKALARMKAIHKH